MTARHLRLLAVLLTVAAPIRADDWSHFRASGGASTETGLPLRWSANENLAWKVELPGFGASTPVAYGERIYVTCCSGYGQKPGQKKTDLKRHLVCVHRDNGRVLWTTTTPASGREHAMSHAIGLHGYASHTPAADDAGVYVFYGASGAAAYSHEGKLKWQKDCGHDNHDWGSASSVVLADRLVVLTAGIESGDVIALDRASGREVWRRRMGESSRWTTPAVAKVNGVDELVFAFEGLATGVDAKTGKTLWTCGCYAWGTPKPLVHDGVVYLTGEARMAAIRLGGRGDVTRTHKLWEVDGGSRCASAVYHNGYLYLVRSEEDIVCCVHAKTGRTEYKERLAPRSGIIYASPLLAEGRVYYVSRDAGVYVVAAAPQFKLLAHNTIAGDGSVFNGSPIVSRGRIVLRSNRFLYCIGERK